MRAAVLEKAGVAPVVREFEDPPAAADGEVLIHVDTTSLGGWDVQGGIASQYAIEYPCVVRGEGVGHTDDGRRVYFGERSLVPFGSWAERTLVPAAEVWEVPDGVSDELAITMAIAGTGALVPLEQAEIKPGESVLVLGATGALGQLALQLARHLGAGRVVGASRSAETLARLQARGIADAVVTLGGEDDAAALGAEAGDGFMVVLDVVYGKPFEAALQATAFGARIMSIGAQAGLVAEVNIAHLFNRFHTCVGTGQRPPADRQAIWKRLLKIARDNDFQVDYRWFRLADAAEAWDLQVAGPHAKVLATIGD